MTAFKLILLGILVTLAALPPLPAGAAGPTIRVVEYYDSATRRFFLTADPVEQEAFDAGGYESTIGRSGLEFDALPPDAETCETRPSGQVVCAGSIVRFNYAAFPWFFYSPKPNEWAQLNAPDSGFIDRGVAFKAFLPENGACPGRVGVYRSYRNQNHRFSPDLASHQRVVAAGAENEGLTFCAESGGVRPIFQAPFLARSGPSAPTVTPEECTVRVGMGECIIANNLQAPRGYEEYEPGLTPQVFIDRTGSNGPFIFSQGDANVTDRAFGSIVQFGGPGHIGLHVNTGNRIIQGPSSFDLSYNLDPYTPPGARDRRLIPFRRTYDVPAEMAVRFQLFVKSVDLGGGSRVAGRLRIALLDVAEHRLGAIAAERRLDFVVQLYGSNEATADAVTREGATFTSLGQMVVTTSIDRATFGRPVNSVPYLFTPPGFVSPHAWGYGGAFEYRIDQAALQRVIDAAREVEPNYSADATQYQVLSYRIENEAEGGFARLGLTASDITLQLLRR